MATKKNLKDLEPNINNENLNIEEKDNQVEEIKSLRDILPKIKADAFKTSVVTITSNDKRDNNITNAVLLNCENQFFAISKFVPLNVAVELEQCLIDSAKDVKIMIHVDEIINGSRTGNSTVELINKYNISYEK